MLYMYRHMDITVSDPQMNAMSFKERGTGVRDCSGGGIWEQLSTNVGKILV